MKGMIYILRRINDFFNQYILKPMLNFIHQHPFIEDYPVEISWFLSITSFITSCIVWKVIS